MLFKYRIKSKIRFTTFIVIMMLSAVCLFGYITGMDEANGSSRNLYDTVRIKSGDTLWTIAENHYGKNTDIREKVYLIKEANHLDRDSINTGDVLLLPVV